MATKRSIAGIAGIVAAATLLSKVFGYARQATILAAFGTGPVSNAFVAAYVVPSFLLVLLGGVNGPFHSAIVSAIAKRPRKEVAPIIETVTTVTGLFFLVVTIGLIIFAAPVIDAFVPGLRETEMGLSVTRPIAIMLLRIMAPITIFASLIGIGFGSLNADDQYWLPSVSPLISSIAVVIGLGILGLVLGDHISDPAYFMVGGITIARLYTAGRNFAMAYSGTQHWPNLVSVVCGCDSIFTIQECAMFCAFCCQQRCLLAPCK